MRKPLLSLAIFFALIVAFSYSKNAHAANYPLIQNESINFIYGPHDNEIHNNVWVSTDFAAYCNTGNVNDFKWGTGTDITQNVYAGANDQDCTTVNFGYDGLPLTFTTGLGVQTTNESVAVHQTYFLSITNNTDTYYLLYEFTGTTIFPGNATLTRIISITPAHQAVIATTSITTFATSIFVSPDDFNSNKTDVTMNYKNLGCTSQLLAGVIFTTIGSPCINKTITFNATTSGYSNFTTTTPLNLEGHYDMETKILSTSIGLFGLFTNSDTLAKRKSNFVVGTTTVADKLIIGTRTNFEETLADQKASSTCLSVFTDPINCIIFLLRPTDESIRQFTNIDEEYRKKLPLSIIDEGKLLFETLTTTTQSSSSLSISLAAYGSTTSATGTINLINPTNLASQFPILTQVRTGVSYLLYTAYGLFIFATALFLL